MPADWQAPLLVSAIVFAAFIVFRSRPMLSAALGPEGRAAAKELARAQERVGAATDDAERALALCDAADASARLGKTSSAVGFYLRAMRVDPVSKEVVERAARSLAKKPGALEKLMWRHLGASPWTGAGHAAAAESLRVLARVYARRKRTEPRARALENALAAIGEAGEASTANRG